MQNPPETPGPPGPPPRPEKRPSKPPEPNLWALAGAGMELAGGVGALAVLGWWLDGKWGTTPWLMVTGAGLGLIGGLYNLWKQTQRFL